MSEVVWKDHGWKHVLDTASELGRVVLKAGIVGEKADEMHGDSDLTNAEVAIINELGTDDGHVPARPFVKRTFQEARGDVVGAIAKAVRVAIFAREGAQAALRHTGEWAANQVRKTIKSNVPPKNAPATIIKKGSSNTLIDTRQLLEAVGYYIARGVSASLDYDEVEMSGVSREGFE